MGYQDEGGEYHGFEGSVDEAEYRLLRRLARRCVSPSILSIDELKALSDAKDLIAKAQIQLYDSERQLLSEASKKKLEKLSKVLGMALESFDIYRKDAPQLDFLLSFCIIDMNSSEINQETGEKSENFQYVGEDVVPGLKEPIESGAFKYIAVSKDFVDAIWEWDELDGRRLLDEASLATGDDEEVMETEIEWWRDNMGYFEDEPGLNLTTMLFRAVRNNVLKSKRTGKPVLAAGDWPRRIEVL